MQMPQLRFLGFFFEDEEAFEDLETRQGTWPFDISLLPRKNLLVANLEESRHENRELDPQRLAAQKSL